MRRVVSLETSAKLVHKSGTQQFAVRVNSLVDRLRHNSGHIKELRDLRVIQPMNDSKEISSRCIACG